MIPWVNGPLLSRIMGPVLSPQSLARHLSPSLKSSPRARSKPQQLPTTARPFTAGTLSTSSRVSSSHRNTQGPALRPPPGQSARPVVARPRRLDARLTIACTPVKQREGGHTAPVGGPRGLVPAANRRTPIDCGETTQAGDGTATYIRRRARVPTTRPPAAPGADRGRGGFCPPALPTRQEIDGSD